MAEYLQRFFVGGLEGLCFSLGRSSYARREAVGGTYILSGAALAAASEGIFVIIHSCFKDKYFPCGEATQGIKEQELRIYCGFDVLCLLLSEVIPLRVFVDNRRRFYSDTLLRPSKNCQSGTK
ncbi:hypothetical protein [Escherichia coli]|uniref:hypothetical protein n=1 Tax=Escherichia coli TaxID=562 RepID=UPI001FCF1E3D|nr:hypothetical protein [Escherichia coli]